MGRRRWTRQLALDALHSLRDRLDRVPSTRDLRRDPNAPSPFTLTALFGSVRRAYEEARMERLSRGTQQEKAVMVPIDPAKAAAITAQKQAFWANGGRASTWVHPYARRRSA